MQRLRLWLLALGGAFLLAAPAVGGTWTANQFLYKPALGARGAAEKNTYDAGQDRVDARLGKEVWVGDPSYGPTLQDAITALGSTPAILRLPPGTHSITADLTVPANITLGLERGAVISVPTGKTLTLNGGTVAGNWQVFSWAGTGKVVFAKGSVKELIAQWWGAKGDGVTNDQPAIQAMIDCSLNSSQIDMFLPPGTYKIQDTLKFGPKSGSYFGCAFRGAANKVGNLGTIIDATYFGDRPALALEGIRGLTLEFITIRGKNTAPDSGITGSSSPLTIKKSKADWVTSGCSDTQHSPYAGIAIDAYVGSAPADPYPGTYGETATSSYITLRRVWIYNFVVGLVVSPADYDNGGDSLTLENCSFSNNTYGFSSGGSQNRSLILQNPTFTGHWTSITTLRHGKQTGNHPQIFGGIFQRCWKFTEGKPDNPYTVNGAQYESMAWLGELNATDSSANPGTTFIGCNFGYYSNAFNDRPAYFYISHNPVTFDGCTFREDESGNAVFNFIMHTTYWTSAFRNCVFSGFPNTKYGYLGWQLYSCNFPDFTNCYVAGIGASDSTYINVNRIVRFGSASSLPTRQLIGCAVESVMVGTTRYKIAPPDTSSEWFMVPVSGAGFNISGGAVKGATLTFGCTNGYDAYYQVGDMIFWRVKETFNPAWMFYLPVFRITNITSTTVTATAIGGDFDTTYDPGAYARLALPRHFNATESTCTTTNGNKVLTNVTNITNWRVGDRIQGTGLDSKARITAIDAGAGTITLNANCSANGSTVAVYNTRLTE